MSTIKRLESKEAFDAFIAAPGLRVVHFGASWAEVCSQVDTILVELHNKNSSFECARVDAEGVPEVSFAHKVTAAPTVLLFKGGKGVSRVDGFHPSEMRGAIAKFSGGVQPSQNEQMPVSGQEALNDRLKALINKSRLSIFIKGTPEQPRCGFTRQALELLNSVNADFSSFDILSDEQVRQGLKEYSQWSTYPQIYLDGELVGGLDLFREEMADPTFIDKLPKLSAQ